MTSSAAVAWQDAVVVARDEGRSMTVASTGLVNETLSGTVAVIERKISYRTVCAHCSAVNFSYYCAHSVNLCVVMLNWNIVVRCSSYLWH